MVTEIANVIADVNSSWRLRNSVCPFLKVTSGSLFRHQIQILSSMLKVHPALQVIKDMNFFPARLNTPILHKRLRSVSVNDTD